jgi:hypothetical protein
MTIGPPRLATAQRGKPRTTLRRPKFASMITRSAESVVGPYQVPLCLATGLKRQDLRADSRGLTEWDNARRDGDPGGLEVGAGLSEVALPDAPLP